MVRIIKNRCMIRKYAVIFAFTVSAALLMHEEGLFA